MGHTEFLTYQKFNDKNLAEDLTSVLAKEGIEFVFEDDTPHFDVSFANNETDKTYLVKLKSIDFKRVDDILTELSTNQIIDADPDHYLFDFSNEELKELLLKSDEWSKYDFLLAQKILKDRGQTIDDSNLALLKNQRIEELAKPEKSQRLSVIAGYVFAFFGGLIGIFIGVHLYSHKKTLPNGERVYSYSDQDRKQGKIIFSISVISAIIWTIYRLANT